MKRTWDVPWLSEAAWRLSNHLWTVVVLLVSVALLWFSLWLCVRLGGPAIPPDMVQRMMPPPSCDPTTFHCVLYA